MSERRYSDEEVAAIFQRAAAAESRALPPGGTGLTLTDLQAIGRDLGIAPDAVEDAARALDRAAPQVSRRIAGVPVGVRWTVELGRPVSDEVWAAFVADLRDTFGAAGVVRQDGAFRQWSNGNLKVMLEPSPAGHRLRFQTFRRRAMEWMAAGMGLLGAALITLLGKGAAAGEGVTFLMFVGLGLTALGALPQRTWVRERRAQMDALAERLLQRLRPGSPDPE